MIPFFKIGIVLVRQISKPISGYIKKKAIENKKFKSICIFCGKKYYFFEQYIQKKFYNANLTNVNYSSYISESKSVNVGSEILGETIIFLTAALIIIAEYKRNSIKEANKELALNHKLETLKLQIKELQQENDEIMKIVLPHKQNSRDNRNFEVEHTNFFKGIYYKIMGQPTETTNYDQTVKNEDEKKNENTNKSD
ncbi:OPA3-like protein, putative [Plasmodium chabaudi chabaudi]|uniref:OPA3-like protein, putative n=2 Tax=Plasmodium chabaudi TaxID=5825 RepID=A0A077TNT3_PLACU|nr:OPA3-like protein, putative [Plasmodium chabaudi chabaudi]SCM04559.1 OPA3-like protein, putative [Plasmodium chabaudi chabaudi]SCM09935.1 OPA3-like protein, putative [Plasmodium chabaudi adami]VTZ70212.1 OPA3-like protein, putative [Plasmodium chabaudi chabaudi]|eukprot:XP_735758.2 OPA3-like protein, putative [Plasmodium chabaudi chabaudi]